MRLEIPPLRERKADIPELAQNYVAYLRPRSGREVFGISHDALEVLTRYEWPGNIRELINVIERAMILCAGEQISLVDLPVNIAHGTTPSAAQAAWVCGGDGTLAVSTQLANRPWKEVRDEALDRIEHAYLSGLLRQCGGRIGETARRAGMRTRSLYDKMKRYGLRKEGFKDCGHDSGPRRLARGHQRLGAYDGAVLSEAPPPTVSPIASQAQQAGHRRGCQNQTVLADSAPVCQAAVSGTGLVVTVVAVLAAVRADSGLAAQRGRSPLDRRAATLGVCFGSLAAAFQGASVVLARSAIANASVVTATIFRILPAAVLLGGWTAVSQRPLLPKRWEFLSRRQQCLGLAAAAFVGTFIGLVFQTAGAKYGSTGIATALSNTYPLCLALLFPSPNPAGRNTRQVGLTLLAVVGVATMVIGGAA